MFTAISYQMQLSSTTPDLGNISLCFILALESRSRGQVVTGYNYITNYITMIRNLTENTTPFRTIIHGPGTN